MMRRRGPGLLRTAGRTAVIAGTATAVSGRVRNRQMEKEQAKGQEQAADQQPAAPQAPLPPPPAGGGDDVVEKLKELASLHEAGALSDEEFAAAKAQALNG